MRELPLNDAIWMYENANVQIQKRHALGHTYRCHLEVNFPNLRHLRSNKGYLINNFDIYLDVNTGELFKRSRSNAHQQILNQSINAGLLSEDDRKVIKNAIYGSLTTSLNIPEKYIGDFNKYYDVTALNNILYRFYETHGIDIKMLDSAIFTEYRFYTRNFLKDIPKLELDSYNIRSLIWKSTNDNEVIHFDQITDSLNTIIDNIDREFGDIINKKLEEKIDLLWIRYLLLRNDAKFSGAHKVSFFRYTGNEKKGTFDIMDIQLNMMSDHKENVSFIKNNADKIRTLLKDIVEHHSRSKKYANFLKLYDLALTRENILVARFCFKDGLEKILCEGGN